MADSLTKKVFISVDSEEVQQVRRVANNLIETLLTNFSWRSSTGESKSESQKIWSDPEGCYG